MGSQPSNPTASEAAGLVPLGLSPSAGPASVAAARAQLCWVSHCLGVCESTLVSCLSGALLPYPGSRAFIFTWLLQVSVNTLKVRGIPLPGVFKGLDPWRRPGAVGNCIVEGRSCRALPLREASPNPKPLPCVRVVAVSRPGGAGFCSRFSLMPDTMLQRFSSRPLNSVLF